MLKLSIIGCGNVAKTMAFLWHQTGVVEIVDVVNRSQASANQSVEFIGAGKPLDSTAQIQSVDIFAIGSGDDQIESCLKDLLEQNVVNESTIIFHFSGAKSSEVLLKPNVHTAKCASLHPVRSFSNPVNDIKNFTDTYCGLEGDKVACETLEKLIQSIGGNCFKVDSDKKMTYHAASVFACNYLVALQELSINTFEHSGVDRELAMKILEPIVKQTTDNIFQHGTVKSLTGPIARGDHKLVTEQFNEVKEWSSDASEVYRLLGKLTTNLSDEKAIAIGSDIEKIKEVFK